MSRDRTIHESQVRVRGALQQSATLCCLGFCSHHRDKVGTVRNQERRVSSLTFLSCMYLEIDACSACLIQGIGHGEFSFNIHTHTGASSLALSEPGGERPLSSTQAGYRKVLKSYFTCLTGNTSQIMGINTKPQHSPVLLCARLPMSP